jgi:hypothetical protein
MKFKYFSCCAGKNARLGQYKLDKELLADRLDAPTVVQNGQKMEILSNTAFSDYHIKLMPHLKNRSLEQNFRVAEIGPQQAQHLLNSNNQGKDQLTRKIDDYFVPNNQGSNL